MRYLAFIFFALPAAATAQDVSYRLDIVARDSFFLVEVVASPAQNGGPRPSVTEYPQLFRSKEQVADYVAYLRKQAADGREQARKLLEAAPRVEGAAAKIEAVMAESASAFDHEKPPPAAKAKKKKRQ